MPTLTTQGQQVSSSGAWRWGDFPGMWHLHGVLKASRSSPGLQVAGKLLVNLSSLGSLDRDVIIMTMSQFGWEWMAHRLLPWLQPCLDHCLKTTDSLTLGLAPPALLPSCPPTLLPSCPPVGTVLTLQEVVKQKAHTFQPPGHRAQAGTGPHHLRVQRESHSPHPDPKVEPTTHEPICPPLQPQTPPGLHPSILNPSQGTGEVLCSLGHSLALRL